MKKTHKLEPGCSGGYPRESEYVACDPEDKLYFEAEVADSWSEVDCSRCLAKRPKKGRER